MHVAFLDAVPNTDCHRRQMAGRVLNASTGVGMDMDRDRDMNMDMDMEMVAGTRTNSAVGDRVLLGSCNGGVVEVTIPRDCLGLDLDLERRLKTPFATRLFVTTK